MFIRSGFSDVMTCFENLKRTKMLKMILCLVVTVGLGLSLSVQKVFSKEMSIQEETKVNTILQKLPSLWKFQLDPDDVGLIQEWFKSDYNDKNWKSIYTNEGWRVQKSGAGYRGIAWYRYRFNIPKAFHNKRIYLHFGGFAGGFGDFKGGEAAIYVNGKNLGYHNGWFQPVRIDITEVSNLKGENTIAIRYANLGGGGGGLMGTVTFVGIDKSVKLPENDSINPPSIPTSFRNEKKPSQVIDKKLMPFGAVSKGKNQKFSVNHISFNGNGFVISNSKLYDTTITRSREFFRIHCPPDEPAKKGEYAKIQGKVKIPELKGRKAYIRFWRRDNYGGKLWTGRAARYEHPHIRFKQFMVNGKLLWQEDTFGDEKEAFVMVDVTREVKEDEYNEITFQLIDLADTPERFPITAHFGVVTLLIEDKKGTTLSELKENQEIHKLKPIKKVVYPEYNINPIPLEVSNPAKTHRKNWPVVSGIAFPEGRLKNIKHLKLTDNKDEFGPCQFEVQSTWHNGSIKWILLSFLTDLLPDEKKTYKLNLLDHAEGHIKTGIKSNKSGRGGYLIDNGVIKFELPSKGDNFLIGRVWIKDKLVCAKALSGRAKFAVDISNGKVLKRKIMLVDKGDFFISPEDIGEWEWHEESAKVKSVEWEREGSLHRTILIKGEYGDADQLQFETRIEVFKDCPHLQIEHIFRVTTLEEMMPIKYIRLKTEPVRGFARDVTVGTQEGSYIMAPLTNKAISLLQLEKDKFSLVMEDIKEEGEHASGWVGVSGKEGSILVGVRYFWQQYPKVLAVSKKAITVDLLQSEKEAMWWDQGEQKSHEILLSFNEAGIKPDELSDQFKSYCNPVYAVNFRYLRTSSALGFMPAESLSISRPELVKQLVDDSLFKEGGSQPLYGIEDFGDYEGPWGAAYFNSYNDTAHGWLNLYVLSENRFWFNRGEQLIRHLADIDVSHFSNIRFDGIDWMAGSTYSLVNSSLKKKSEMVRWKRHRVSPGIMNTVFLNGMDTYSFLTGKKRFYKTFADIADYILRTGIQQEVCQSIRRYAIPGFSLMRAYNTTGDKKYLEGAKRIINKCLSWEKHMPGCFTDKPIYLGYEPVWGNVNYPHSLMNDYRSAAGFMIEYLSRACRDLYLATGDDKYAQAVVGTAEWVWDELLTDDLRQHYSTGPGPGYYGAGVSYGNLSLMLSLRAFALTHDLEYFERAEKLLKAGDVSAGIFFGQQPFSENFHYMEQSMQEKSQGE